MVWTNPEINEYRTKRIIYPSLEQLYHQRKILETNPEGRAKFLAEEVIQLTMSDQELIMGLTKERGRAEALIALEDMVITIHREKCSHIAVPL